MDVAVTISSGSLYQYGTTRTLNAWWRQRVLHHCWWIFKISPRSPMRVGAAKTASHGKSRRPCIILYMQIRSPRIRLRTRGNSCGRWKAVSYGTWRNPFTNFIANFWTLSKTHQSRERMGEDTCIAYSRRGRLNALHNWRKILGIRAAKSRFRQKSISRFFCSTGNVIVGTKSSIQEKS